MQWNDYCTRFKSYPAGVWVTTDLDASQLERVLDHVELVVVEFPRSRDGRGFTLARLLRERHHYQGDIRAAGPLLPDQFSVLLECGYTSLLASSSVPLVRWRDAADSLSQARAKPRTLLDRLSRHRHS
nr:DUF934 domain-containing protein [Cupriavidus sp. YR651]